MKMTTLYQSAADALADKTPGSRAIQGKCAEAFKLAGNATQDIDGNTAWYCVPLSQASRQDMEDEKCVWIVGVSRTKEASWSSIGRMAKKYPAHLPAGIERLQAAIKEFKAEAGPVTFTAKDNGDTLTLFATYLIEVSPDDNPFDDEPWAQYGGYKILKRAGYYISCSNSGSEKYCDRYDDVKISQWTTFDK